MMSDLKLSVITVTYNASKTIERTLQSVAKQTCSNVEHIIVDGKSSDNTMKIVRRHQNNQLKSISEPDNGLYDAMNKAVTLASGDYLCFLNAGDTFFGTNTVENLLCSANSANVPDIIYGETAIVDDHSKFLRMRRLKTPEELTWKSFRNGMLVCHQAFIIKKSIFEPYDLLYRFSADVDWCIRMMKKAETIYNTHQILVNYLNEGTTTANHKASLKERYRIMVKHYGSATTLLMHIRFAIRYLLNPEK